MGYIPLSLDVMGRAHGYPGRAATTREIPTQSKEYTADGFLTASLLSRAVTPVERGAGQHSQVAHHGPATRYDESYRATPYVPVSGTRPSSPLPIPPFDALPIPLAAARRSAHAPIYVPVVLSTNGLLYLRRPTCGRSDV